MTNATALAHNKPLSEPLLKLGRRLGDTYAAQPLTEDERERVSVAYARLCQHSRTLIHHDINPLGQSRTLVVFDQFMWVVDNGLPWCFHLPKLVNGCRRQVTQPVRYLKRYERFLMGESTLKLEKDAWFLSSFSQGAREVAERWMIQDLKLAFRMAGIEGGSEHQCNWKDKGAEKMRMVKGRVRNMPYLLRIVGAALREVREVLDRDVRRTLWSIQAHDGRLARWLLEAPEGQARQWRTQALKLHRITVPMAFQKPLERVHPWSSIWTAPIQTLSRQVDKGQPVVDAISDILEAHFGKREDSFHSWHNDDTQLKPTTTWTGEHVQFLARHGAGLSVARVINRFNSHILDMAQLGRGLSPARAPRTLEGWETLRMLAREWQDMGDILEGHRVEAFLKGCPVDWSDPFYGRLNNQMAMVRDAARWTGSKATQRAMFQTMTWRQMVNFAYRIHDMHEAFMAKSAPSEGPVSLLDMERRWKKICRWDPAGLEHDWVFQNHYVHELTCMKDTEDEGQRMRHCVGNGYYAEEAIHGYSRLFSIRETATKKAISTFEVKWNQASDRLEVQQHFGPRDREPKAIAKTVLKSWLAKKRYQRGPWPANATAVHHWMTMDAMRRDWDQTQRGDQEELRSQFKAKVRAELELRYPQIRKMLEQGQAPMKA